MIKTCRSSQTRAKYAKNSKSNLSTITKHKHLLLLLAKKKNIFKHRIPLRVFARKFLTFYKLLYNWLSCNNSSTLTGYSYTMGMACPALFSRRLWRMRPTQKTAARRLEFFVLLEVLWLLEEVGLLEVLGPLMVLGPLELLGSLEVLGLRNALGLFEVPGATPKWS